MTKLEFVKLIISERDFEVKSRYFGEECRMINGENYIVLYDESIAPAVEIARWRKKYFANYLDYRANADKRNSISMEQANKIINGEQAIFDKIFDFIGAEKAQNGYCYKSKAEAMRIVAKLPQCKADEPLAIRVKSSKYSEFVCTDYRFYSDNDNFVKAENIEQKRAIERLF